MSSLAPFVVAVMAAVPGAQQGAPPAKGVDVLRYDLQVTIRNDDLAVEVAIHARGQVPAKWSLELAPELRVVTAACGGRPLTFTREGGAVVLDGSAIALHADGTFVVTLKTEGSPREEQKSRGFVRSVVRPDVVYIRSQHAWFPRIAEDPAVVRTVVDARAGWQVRTAGDFDPPTVNDHRATWTFTTKVPVDRTGLAAGPWIVRSSEALNALAVPEHANAADGLLVLARKAIEFHGKDLGPLARSRYSIVEVPREFGRGSGYSESGYILVGPGAFEDGASADWVAGLLAHEIAHQWWGMDGLFRDFASESLAEYSTLRFRRAVHGSETGTRIRRTAIEAVLKSATAGKETALADIKDWGSGMDGETYRVHAYEKAMLLLAMMEQAVGDDAMTKLLRRFLELARSRRVGWSELRTALAAAGPASKTILEQWEVPGIPELREEHAAKQTGATWTVTGKLVQSGTKQPFRMTVPVVAICGDQRVSTTVKLDKAEATFTLRTPASPDGLVIDPDWLVLASRPVVGRVDKKQVLDSAFKVVNDQAQADPQKLAATLAALHGLVQGGAVSGDEEAVCHTGIGHCLFRQGKLDEAAAEFEVALKLGAGGPFHRGWVHLRLGNIADLRGDRDKALEQYQATVGSSGSSKAAVTRAKQFLDKPYRGYQQDG